MTTNQIKNGSFKAVHKTTGEEVLFELWDIMAGVDVWDTPYIEIKTFMKCDTASTLSFYLRDYDLYYFHQEEWFKHG